MSEQYREAILEDWENAAIDPAFLTSTITAATERMMQMEEQLKQEWGLEESLKASDPMNWVQKMNQIRQAAEEIVLKEIIYN